MRMQELTKQTDAPITCDLEKQAVYLPAVDVREMSEAIVVKLDMPGVSKDNVDVQVENNRLVIVGQLKTEWPEKLLYSEQQLGDYRREFSLGEDLDQNHITARMDAGVLTLTIAKTEKVKPRKVEIAAV